MNIHFTRLFLFSSMAFFACTAWAQQKPVLLTESTFTVRNSSSEEFYYGFAEGDQITFSVSVSDNTIKGVDFYEYPSSTIFSQSNVGNIDNKTININHNGIYYFSFHQSGFLAGKRTCTLKATRLAANAKTAGFNTTVYWESKTDTVWYNEDEKYLINIDTLITQVADQAVTLKKKGKTDRSMIMFSLPEKLDCWSIWIGTGKDATTNFANSEKQLAITHPYVKKYGLMTALALTGSASFVSEPGCKQVSYWFLTNQKDQQKFNTDSVKFLADKKMACLDYASRKDTLKGINYIGVYNENKKSMEVFVKVASVRIVENWGTRSVRKFRIETKQIPYLKN